MHVVDTYDMINMRSDQHKTTQPTLQHTWQAIQFQHQHQAQQQGYQCPPYQPLRDEWQDHSMRHAVVVEVGTLGVQCTVHSHTVTPTLPHTIQAYRGISKHVKVPAMHHCIMQKWCVAECSPVNVKVVHCCSAFQRNNLLLFGVCSACV